MFLYIWIGIGFYLWSLIYFFGILELSKTRDLVTWIFWGIVLMIPLAVFPPISLFVLWGLFTEKIEF